MTSLLLLGGSGQLGKAMRLQADASWHVQAPNSDLLNLSHSEEVQRYITKHRPNVVVNCAAYTKVDAAESERDIAFQVNAAAPAVMALATRSIGAHFIHVSTDYVFDGTGEIPYQTFAATNPLNAYGASKLAGEQAVARDNPNAVIIRTSWIHSGGGLNFVATAVRMLGAGQSMRVVDDQIGVPTRAANLAYAVLSLVERRDVSGLLHVTDGGVASWYDVAMCVLETMRSHRRVSDDVTVSPIQSSEFSGAAKRPNVSLLSTHTSRKIIGWTPPHWREGVVASTRELLSQSLRQP